jgi:hypothetical protein
VGRVSDLQFVLYDDESHPVLGEGHAIPCWWDGAVEGCVAVASHGGQTIRRWIRPATGGSPYAYQCGAGTRREAAGPPRCGGPLEARCRLVREVVDELGGTGGDEDDLDPPIRSLVGASAPSHCRREAG